MGTPAAEDQRPLASGETHINMAHTQMTENKILKNKLNCVSGDSEVSSHPKPQGYDCASFLVIYVTQ